jgi:hypothetical protein
MENSAVIRENKSQLAAIRELVQEMFAPYHNIGKPSPEVTEIRNAIYDILKEETSSIEPLPFGEYTSVTVYDKLDNPFSDIEDLEPQPADNF